MTTNTPTPGQVCYAAYCRITYGRTVHLDDYSDLTWGQQEAWEAAAQAVLQWQAAPPLTLDLDPDVQREETP